MKISERSTITLGVAFFLVAAASAAVRLEGRLDVNQAETRAVAAQAAAAVSAHAESLKVVSSIDRRLSRIEGAMGLKARAE